MLFLHKERIEKIVTKKRGKIVNSVRHIFYQLFLPIWENGLWCARVENSTHPFYQPSPLLTQPNGSLEIFKCFNKTKQHR